MKLFLLAILLVAANPPARATDFGVSLSVGDPGFYGRLDIGDYPAPQLLYSRPRIIERVPYGRPPIYMRVPPGHARNWRRHCSAYNACDEQVYFVRDNWYNREYIPRYQERYGQRYEGRHDGRGDRRDHDHGGRNDHDRGDGNDHDRGGNGRGHNR